MVYYFKSNVVSPAITLFMGKDKVENEDLIKYGVEEDVWFHVDKLSSAHVYLRLAHGQSWENIDEAVLVDIGQLTKANSIEGNKKNNITIIYTPWSNLKKTGDMPVGQVSFHNHQVVKRIHIEARDNSIINRLNKTKREEYPDLSQMKIDHKRNIDSKYRKQKQQQLEKEKEIKQQRLKEKEERSYDRMFDSDLMSTNKYTGDGDVTDDDLDFM
ncbi:DUF814-domain-containing protein, partial [Conidiobolus coronatus NRRL 28638]